MATRGIYAMTSKCLEFQRAALTAKDFTTHSSTLKVGKLVTSNKHKTALNDNNSFHVFRPKLFKL